MKEPILKTLECQSCRMPVGCDDERADLGTLGDRPYLCNSCYMERTTVRIKVESDYMGWMAYDAKQGVDFSCENGEDWTNCGSPIGTGATIQEAIDSLMEILNEERAGLASPDDDSFEYKQKFKWN